MTGLAMDDVAISDLDLDFGDIGLEGLDLDLGAFDLGIDDPSTVTTRYVKPPVYIGSRRAPVLYDNAVEFVHEVGDDILAGERVDAVVSGNFIFGDIFEALAVEYNLLIDDLTFSTLSMSPDNIASLRNLLVGDYINALNIIVSDYWYSHNRAGMPAIYEALDVDDKFQLAVSGTHTKVTLLKIGDQKIVINGSANFRSSRSIENFTVETLPEVYDFHMAWHRKILDHYGTIRKSIRANALFDLITKGG